MKGLVCPPDRCTSDCHCIQC